MSAAFVIFLIAVSNPAHAFSHCPVVLPSPAWPLRSSPPRRSGASQLSYAFRTKGLLHYRRGLLQHFAHFYEKAIESYTHAVALKTTLRTPTQHVATPMPIWGNTKRQAKIIRRSHYSRPSSGPEI